MCLLASISFWLYTAPYTTNIGIKAGPHVFFGYYFLSSNRAALSSSRVEYILVLPHSPRLTILSGQMWPFLWWNELRKIALNPLLGRGEEEEEEESSWKIQFFVLKCFSVQASEASLEFLSDIQLDWLLHLGGLKPRVSNLSKSHLPIPSLT